MRTHLYGPPPPRSREYRQHLRPAPDGSIKVCEQRRRRDRSLAPLIRNINVKNMARIDHIRRSTAREHGGNQGAECPQLDPTGNPALKKQNQQGKT